MKARSILTLAACVTITACGTTMGHRAQVPQTYQEPPQQPMPVVQAERTEPWMSCAAGGIKSLLRANKPVNVNVAVYPIVNETGERSLQTVIDVEAAHVVHLMGLHAYMVGFKSGADQIMSMTPKIVLRTEVSMVDRVISAAEAEREIGLTFGRGNGAGALSRPSLQKVSHGRVRAVTAAEVFTFNQSSRRIHRRVANTHVSEANVLSRTTSHGTDFYLLLQYGESLAVKEVAGAQRALLAAARASMAGAILKSYGIDPAICGI